MKSSNYIIPVALGALFVSCNGKADENADTAVIEEDEVAVVEVDVAHRRSVDLHREYTANVEADNVNNISPAVSNRIQSITVDVGDNVHKGQVLATLDPANADQQRINLEQAERDYNRAVKLLEIGAGTETAVNQMKTQLDVLRTQYNNTMTNTVLKSPINGVVIARNYDPGDMTGAQPILTVGQIVPNVKLIINVNESDISVIKRNQAVDITFDAFEGETFTGHISRISPAVDITSRTFPVEVSVANKNGRILPGMFARVDINLGTRDNVVVPDRAVVKQNGSANKYVYTYSNGVVSFKKVELGQRLDDAYELLDGIEDGDTVVIAGQVRLNEGAKAKINQHK